MTTITIKAYWPGKEPRPDWSIAPIQIVVSQEKDVRTTTITPSVIIVVPCSNHGVVPRDGHAVAEIVILGRIRGREFLLLRPGRPGASEDVRATRLIVMSICSNYGVISGDGHAVAEIVI